MAMGSIRVAKTYNQLGKLARERGDFVSAEYWHKKSLNTNLK